MIRAYLPCSLPAVIAWYDAGAVPAGVAGHGVTAALRATHPEADEEELEFLATRASDAQAQAQVAQSGQRRATLAVDLPDAQGQPADGAPSALRTGVQVPVADWAAVFVDDLEWYAVSEVPHLR